MKKLLCTFVAFGALAVLNASAQSPQQIADMTKSMPDSARQTIERLGQLNRLQAGQWKVHPGDLAHGESTTLDDSGWAMTERPAGRANGGGAGAGRNANPPQEYGPGAVWFRQVIEVPKSVDGYDITGSRIWFSFNASAASPGTINEIVYFNGRRVALGESLEQLVLFENAKPGDKVLVAVKLLETPGKKTFRGSMLRVEFASDRPNPTDLRDEFLSTATLIPSISKNVQADQATLNKAVALVDTKALDAGDQKKFDASLKAAQTTLESLEAEQSKFTFHLTGNSHIDAAWLWPETETVDVVHRTFGTALQLLNEYPGYTYTQSAAQYNEWMADKYPALNDEIKQRIKEGRWEVVGGMWVEPDLNIPDGESTARSILIGKRWYQKNYGVDVRVGWNPDSFGYNWQLPQIYKKSGIDFFVTQKMSWNDTNKLPLKLFWWESPDGSKVLTYFPNGYGNRQMDPVRLSADLVSARTNAPGMPSIMDLYGVGDHGGGPTRDMLDEAQHWMSPDKVTPKMVYGTATPYLDSMEKLVAPESKTWDYKSIGAGYQYPAAPPDGMISVPTWKDELYLEYHRGVYTTQAAMKNNLRKAPEWTLNAEKYASLAWLHGDAYPGKRLTDAWEKITFNGFHDLAAGSGIAVIYRDAQKDFDVVRWETNEISAKALNTLAERIDTKVATGVPVMVFNPLAWERSGMFSVYVQMPSATSEVYVLDAKGNVLPSETLGKNPATNIFHLMVEAKNVPSMGYEILRVVSGAKTFTSDLKVNGTTLENAALRVTVDPATGCITSLYDKRSNFESLAAGSCGNQLQAFEDKPKNYDAWNIDPGTYDKAPTIISQVDSVKVVENTPLRASIKVMRTWQKSKFSQTITLYNGGEEVEVSNDIDWQETHVLLKSSFTLAATAPEATYEIPYGTIERPTTRNNSFEKARFEVPAQHWADLGDGKHGFSFINESKFGYDAVGNQLRLTLLRSPIDPDPNADKGMQHFSYTLYPHTGTWKDAMSVRHGYEYNYKLSATQVNAHPGALPAEHSFVGISGDNVVLTAMKKAEDSNALVFHLYEWAGKSGDLKVTVPEGATKAEATNLMENTDGGTLVLNSNVVTVPVHPFEIVAFRVDYTQPTH